MTAASLPLKTAQPMTDARHLTLLIIVWTVCLVHPVHAQVADVWAVGDGEKIFRYEADYPFKSENSVWDGEMIHLRGLRNEVLGFQLIVVADSTGASTVEIDVKPPVHSKTDHVIGGAGASPYSADGGVKMFSQHYLKVDRPTEPNWFYGSEAAAPAQMTGWIPDALIPANALQGRGGFPIDIPPTEQQVYRRQDSLQVIPAPPVQNQGFWIDLYLPRDRSYPAGTYSGSVIVRSAGEVVERLPLDVELVDAYLPDENHSNVWMFTSGVDEYFPNISDAQVDRMIKHTAHRHRIDAVGGFQPHRSAFDSTMMQDYLPYLNGDAFTPANGYQGPGQAEGENLFPIGMYGSNVLGDSRESMQRESDKWVQWFEENAPNVQYYWYMIDEPGEVQFPYIREQAGWIHDNPGPGSELPVFTTREYTPALDDAIDVWAGGQNVELEELPHLKEEGKDHMFYNGYRPRYGSVILEAAAVDLRVNAWMKYLYGVNTWFLWHSTHWQHNMQGPKGHLHQRVFEEPLTFISWGMSFGNGDGVVLYPGRMPFYPDQDRGLNEILPSIRLKNIRRGQQDYEIMRLAARTAGRERVEELIRTVVPRGFSEVEETDEVPWSVHGNDYDRVRSRLIDLVADQ